jgi:hypothetical protein
MNAHVEIRVFRKQVRDLFSLEEMQVLNPHTGTSRLRVPLDDPRLLELSRRGSQGRALWGSWEIIRRYGRRDLDAAALLTLDTIGRFWQLPAECGTAFDDAPACPICGAGRIQMSPLRLDLHRAPKRLHIAHTPSHELVIRHTLAQRLIAAELTGFILLPVLQARRGKSPSPIEMRWEHELVDLLRQANSGIVPAREKWVGYVVDSSASEPVGNERRWYQLVPSGTALTIGPATRFGDDFAAPASATRCPAGDTVGLVRLSELSVIVPRKPQDFAVTAQYFGWRVHDYVPQRAVVVSQRFATLLRGLPGGGYRLEPTAQE